MSMKLTKKFARFLLLLLPSLWVAAPGLADDGDGANICVVDFPCEFHFPFIGLEDVRDFSRPGSVIVFPKFIRDGFDAICGIGNVFFDGICRARTEIELGAVCPTRFTTGDQNAITHPEFACAKHEPVRVRFRWVCPGSQDTEPKFVCKTRSFDVSLTVDGKVVFTSNGVRLPDANQVSVPPAPCERGYLIGWVIDDFGRPKKYDGLIGEATIRESGTATAVYRGIPIQAEGTLTPGDPVDVIPDPLGSMRLGLPFGPGGVHPYRLITAQVTGDVTFDKSGFDAGLGFGTTTTSLILLTLDVRSDSPNFPTQVNLDFWNGFEEKLLPTPSVKFVCWGEFQLSRDIDLRLTQAFMGTRKGIVQSDEAFKTPIPGVPDYPPISSATTLLGLVQTNESLILGSVARSSIVELYNNGISFWSTAFFP
jgi:hypothetical protein